MTDIIPVQQTAELDPTQQYCAVVDNLKARIGMVFADPDNVDPKALEDLQQGLWLLAVETFGDEQKARRWIESPVMSLGGDKPSDIVVDRKGCEDFITVCGWITFGVHGYNLRPRPALPQQPQQLSGRPVLPPPTPSGT